MAKFFAITIVVIAILSAIPILRHTWVAPEDISTHGYLIDEQMSETMAEAGVAFPPPQLIPALFIWNFFYSAPAAKTKKLTPRPHWSCHWTPFSVGVAALAPRRI